MTIPPPDHKRYFIEKLGLSERLMERCLGEALSAGGDYADLYFESVTSTALGIDESLVKTAAQGISLGCGVRVVSGERTGYAYTDDLSSDCLLRAARTAALIASGPAKELMSGFHHVETPALYPVAGATTDAEIAAKLALIQRADKAARAYDSRITQVRAGFNDETSPHSHRSLRRHLRQRHPASLAIERLCHREGRPEHRTRRQRRRRARHHGLLRSEQIAGALRPRSRPHRHSATRRH